MLHLNDRCFYSCLWITPDLRCQKRLWILCFSTKSIKIWRSGAFFAFSPLHLSEPLRKQKVVVRDLWLVDFDPFCVFLCFKVRCFVFEKHRKFYLSSKIFFIFFTLKHGKFRFQRWNCSYRASKSRGNTATEGWKRTGTFPLTFTFADKRSICYGNGLIDVAENLNLEHAQYELSRMSADRGSFLFPTYLGRSKETLFAGWVFAIFQNELEARKSLAAFFL